MFVCVCVCACVYAIQNIKKIYFIQQVIKNLMDIKRWMDMRNKSLPVGFFSWLPFQLCVLENGWIYGLRNGTQCLNYYKKDNLNR